MRTMVVSLPTVSGLGTPIRGLVAPGNVAVNTLYDIPIAPTGRVTTIVYDVSITLCNTTAGCPASTAPTFSTNNPDGTATGRIYIVQDTTAGASIFVDMAAVDDSGTGLTCSSPKKYLRSGLALASSGMEYVAGGTYCEDGSDPVGPPAPAALTGARQQYHPGQASMVVFNRVRGTDQIFTPVTGSNIAVINWGFNDNATSVGMSLGSVNTTVNIEGITLNAQVAMQTVGMGYNTLGLRATAGSGVLSMYKNTIIAAGAPGAAGPGAYPGGLYGAHLSNVNKVVLSSNTISAGRGWPGANGGTGGIAGAVGEIPGADAVGGSCDGGCPIIGCGGCQQGGAGGTGGASPISNSGGSGGRGGAEDSCVGSGNGANGTLGLPSTAFGNGGGSGNPGNQGGDGTPGAPGSNGSGGPRRYWRDHHLRFVGWRAGWISAQRCHWRYRRWRWRWRWRAVEWSRR